MDMSKLGVLVSELMEYVEERFELAEDAYLRTIAIVCEVDGKESSTFVVRSNEDRAWALTAFLDRAAQAVEDLDAEPVPGAEEDE